MKLKTAYLLIFWWCGVNLFSQSCNITNFMSAIRIPVASFPYTSPTSGITVSVTTNCSTLSNFTYPCGTNSYAGASPAWWINAASQYIIFTFSAPISKYTILVNGTNQTEVFYSNASAGTVSLSDYCTPDFVASANTVTDMVVPAEGAIISTNVTSATTFTITHNGLGSGSRVTLLDCFVPASVLPIELMSFTAECVSKNNIILNWKTASETNNEYFTIEKSRDAINWSVFKIIPSHGNTTLVEDYSCSDNTIYDGTLYYRLKQTDFNGHYKRSGIVTVNTCNELKEIEIYPNPVTDELTVSGVNIDYLRIMNITGEVVYNKVNDQGTRMKMNLSDLPAGIYFVNTGDKNYKIIKQ